jgi:carboxymethylenebutenolidase
MSDVTIVTAHGDMPGYFKQPAGDGPWPGVVVIHDALGYQNDTVQQVDWLAAEGFLTVAPDLFFWNSRPRCIRQAFMDVRARKGQSFDDVEATRAWLAAQPGCTGSIGVIGYCMGGAFALLMAPDGHGFSASSVNYGMVPKDVAEVVQGACPIVGSYGKRDQTLRHAAARLDGALATAGVPHDVKEYPDAGHGFLNDHRGAGDPMPLLIRLMSPVLGMGYVPEAAADARLRIAEFFRTHLG